MTFAYFLYQCFKWGKGCLSVLARFCPSNTQPYHPPMGRTTMSLTLNSRAALPAGVGPENKLSLLLPCSSEEEQRFTGWCGRGPHQASPWPLNISHRSFKRLPLLPRPQQLWSGRNPALHCHVSNEPGAANVHHLGHTQSSKRWRGSAPCTAGETREWSCGEPAGDGLLNRERLGRLFVILVSITLGD